MAQPNQGLWVLFILQSICAVFFGFDAVSDFLGWENSSPLQHLDIAEYAAAAILLASLWFSGKALARVIERNKRMKQQIGVASGAFNDLLEQHFDDWALTASEREVATLAIKGLSIAEIAALRETKEGTIKAQSAAIYRKAGVTGRLQLLSLFIEELMAEPLMPPAS